MLIMRLRWYSVTDQSTAQWTFLVNSRETNLDNLRSAYGRDYTSNAFDERVTFWLQRARSLPCACAFAALYACAIA